MNARLVWELVPTFLVLAEQLHYGDAASRLGISRQALAKRIARLESELGVSLLVRPTRRVHLTDAGAVLRDEALPVLAALDRAVQRTRSPGSGARLTIVVSTDLPPRWAVRVQEWIGTSGVPTLLERRAPEDALHLLRTDELDLALLAADLDLAPSVTIDHEPTVVLVPTGHRAARQQEVRAGDLFDLEVAVGDGDGIEQRREAVALLRGDPDLPYVVAPRLGTAVHGLVHTARQRGAAALTLRHGIEQVDTTGFVALPTNPPHTVPVVLAARGDAVTGPLRALADHLLT
jgi:DNA-binding transcriptional LysR family regulator